MSITRSQTALFALFITSAPLTIDMFLPAMPALAESLGATPGEMGQTLSIFFIGFALGQLIAGPLSDRLGRKPVLLSGLVLLLAGSLLAALANSVSVVLIARIIQALGVCSLTVTSRASINDLLTEKDAARVFSLLLLVGGVVPVIAPWVGTGLVALFGWQGVFGFLVILAGFLLFATATRLPESHIPSNSTHENPLISYAMVLANPKAMAFIFAGGFSLATLFTFLGAAPPVLSQVYGLEQGAYATVFTLNAAALVLGSQINRIALRNREPGEILYLGAIIMVALGALMIIAAFILNAPLIPLLVIQYLITTSLALVQANGVALALSSDPHRAGAAAALFGACGFALGAVLSTIANNLFDGTNHGLTGTIAGCQFATAACILVGVRLKAKTAATQIV